MLSLKKCVLNVLRTPKKTSSKFSYNYFTFNTINRRLFSNNSYSTPKLSHYKPIIPPSNNVSNNLSSFSIKGVDFDARPMYLDVQATSPIDPRVVDTMNEYNCLQWGNPHSRTHMFGWETEDAVEDARGHIAKLIGANPKEIIFTSGATESNNLSLKGCAYFSRRKPKKHIITLQTEHKCVLDSCRQLELEGFEVTYLPVKQNGIVDLELLESSIQKDNTLMISTMFVNNEIGVIQPIKEIGNICRKHNVYFHVDAAQACGKVPIDVNELNIDLMSISGHKLYGPKGIGALYIRRRNPRVQLKPIINGGGQERGMRSGTLPAPLCIGMGKAFELAYECLEEDYEHVTRLSKKLIKGLTDNLEEIVINGSDNLEDGTRYPGNVNISFSFVEGESLLMGMKNVCVSSGSACTSASLEPSYVLRAIGVSDDLAHTSIRFGIGRFTTDEEINYVIHETVNHVTRLREMSPLYDMFKDGSLKDIEWTQH